MGRKRKKANKRTNKQTTIENKKAIWSAVTGTELRDLMQWWRVEIGVNTYYKIYSDNTDLRAGIRKIASKIWVKGFHFIDNAWNTVPRPAMKNAVKKIFSDPERGVKNFISFKREIVKDFYIAGEIYMLPIFSWMGQLLNFQILDPRTITKVYNNEWEIIRFEQRSTTGSKIRKYDPDKIYFYKLENDPKNPVNGLSLLHSVIWDVLTDKKATERNYYFFENDKVPRSVLQLSDDYDYSDPNTMIELEKLKQGMNWTDEAHKMITSNLVKDIKILELTNKDMEFINQRKLTTDKVSALLGVPKTELWYSDNINYATAQQFYATFIDWKVKPDQEEFNFIYTDALRKFSTSFDKLNIVLETDDTVDIYEQHKDERLDVQAGVLTVDEVRNNRGLEEMKDSDKPDEEEPEK